MDAVPLEYLPFPACILSRRGILRRVNISFTQMLGHGETDIFRGLPFAELFIPEEEDHLNALMAKCDDPDSILDERIEGCIHDLFGTRIRVSILLKCSPRDEEIFLQISPLSGNSLKPGDEVFRCRLGEVFLENGEFPAEYTHILRLLLDETSMESGAVYAGDSGKKSLVLTTSVGLRGELESILRSESLSQWSAGEKILFFGRRPEDITIPPVLRQAGVSTAVLLPAAAGEASQVLYALFSRTKSSWLPLEVEKLRRMHGPIGKATQRLLREQTLTNSETLYRSLIRSMPSGLIVRDRKGGIIHFNLAAAQIFGWDSDKDISPSRLMEGVRFLKEDNTPIPADQLPGMRSLTRGIKIRNEEIQALLRDGNRVWLSVNSEPLYHSGEKEPYAMVATFKNITGSRRVMAELDQARLGAEEADKTKSRFLANFSHEIRTPLSGIMGMTDILLTGELDPEQRDQLLLMKDAEDSLLDIINKVLDLSRIEAGRVRLKIGVLHLPETLRRIATSYIMRRNNSEFDFRIEISEKIPEYLIGDEAHLQLVIANLVENAFKFTEAGTITLAVNMYGEISRDIVPLLFSVSDTGRGIPRDAQERVFDKFQQLDSSFSKEHQGTGLGLPISKQIIEQMGGSIWLESELGQGSTFFFNLELRRAGESEIADPETVPSKFEQSKTENPLHILLVEDNTLNQEAIGHMLKNRGHRVSIAGNGFEALKILPTSRFDLVLMDIQMPKMNGIEATKKIREGHVPGFDPRIPVIALTAYAMPGEVKIIMESGMNAYVSKPVSRIDLLRTIEKTLGLEDKSAADSIGYGNGILSEFENFSAEPEGFRNFVEDYRNDIDVACQLLDLFSRDVPGKISTVKDALKRRDHRTLIDNFHSLTNNLSAVRLYSLGQLSRDMEKYSLLEDFQALDRKFPLFDRELERSLTEARKYLQIVRGMKP